MNLLLVEDNQPLAHWLHKLLTEQGFAVELADNGAAADQLLAQRRYQLVLLDLSLPGLSGRAVLRRLRARGDDTPVLVLTASDDLDQKVDCLDLGADDYVTKPVEMRELAARIRVLIRRRLPGKANTLACGRLGYSLQTHQFTLDDAPFALPPRERALLETLMLQQGSAVSKQVLLDGLGESARVIGAVNCVVAREGRLVGENTDGRGFLESLRATIDPRGREIVLFGAGGAARAVGRACAQNSIAVLVPCHRVVRGDGGLAGYRWGVERKRELLARERGR